MVKYKDLNKISGYDISNLHQLWSYGIHVSLGSISLNIGPLCTGLISTWLSLVESRCKHTVLSGLGTMTKLLYHSAFLYTPSGASISCCSVSSSLMNGFCSVYVMCLRSGWYGFVSSLPCREKVPLKHSIPVNTSLYLSCILSLVSALTTY